MDIDSAIFILKFIRHQYEKEKDTCPGVKKYIDALALGIAALKDKKKGDKYEDCKRTI